MPLAGIKLVRQTFGDLLPKGWSVAQAYMNLKHDAEGEWQVLTFHVIDPSGGTRVVTSDKVRSRDDVNALAAATAKNFLASKEVSKNGPPAGSDAKNGGQ